MTATDRTVLDQLVSETKHETAPEMKDDEFFELFCAQSLLVDQQLEPEEIKFGLVGSDEKLKSGSDGGIDAIYVLVNGKPVRSEEDAEVLKSAFKQNVEIEVILIQASREEGFKLQRLLRFKDTIEDIFSLDRDEFSENYNESLREAIAAFRALHRAFATKHAPVFVRYFYMTRGDTISVASDVRGLKDEIESKAGDILATIKKCSVVFIGARELFELASRTPIATHPLKCSTSMSQEKGKAYVALVKLTDYLRFITDEKGNLRTNFFDANIRDYQGEIAVNEAIGKTLLTGKEEFWWLNNGITIVTSKVGGHMRELVIDDPQIVNGLQTSQKIFDHFKSRPDLEQSENRELLVRVIQVDNAETHDAIIEATNSQTRISPSSFWATKQIHRDIETVFRNQGLFYDRRKNSYRRKGIPLAKVVGISELAQAVAAILLQEPDHARARPARYFQDADQHDRIFSDKYEIGIYGVAARLGKKVDSFLRENEANRGSRHNLLFYTMMVVTCMALKTAKPRSARITTLDTGKLITEDLLRKSWLLTKSEYHKQGGNDKAAKGTEMLAALKKQLKEKFGRKTKKKIA